MPPHMYTYDIDGYSHTDNTRFYIIQVLFFLNLFIYLFIYLFLAVLGLRFCARAFSSCGERGPLLITVRGPLTIAVSLVAEHRLQTHRLSSCGSRACLLAPLHVGSSQTRARTRVPCIGRQILNHCATREAPIQVLSMKNLVLTRNIIISGM